MSMTPKRNDTIYLDHAATTPTDQRVLEAMLPYYCVQYGNAASRQHGLGRDAEAAVAEARESVGELIGADSKEIVWTSGATEANNAAILGVYEAEPEGACHIISQETEHPAILDPCREIERRGGSVTLLPVDSAGLVDSDLVRESIRPQTKLVSIMAANNETGVMQPTREIAQICHDAGVLFHTDATQAVGKIPIDVSRDGIDMMSLSAHKVYGPKGVGCLYVRSTRPRIRLRPRLFGGGHERGFRSGTINVPGVVGLGKACEIARHQMGKDADRLGRLRDRLEAALVAGISDVYVNCSNAPRLPNIANVRFDHVEAESLLMMMDDVALSTGSACSTMKIEPSHVLLALGLDEAAAFGSVRFSLGRDNTEDQIDYVIERLIAEIARIRQLNPFCA